MAGREAAEPPTTARERTARAPGARTFDSALTAGEFAAVTGAGFDPVALVLGTAVFHLGYSGAWCSYQWSSGTRTDVSSQRWAPFSDLVDAMYSARRQALGRAVAECRALGADGIVGVSLRVGEFPAGGMEFTAVGTAVLARSGIRPQRPFTSHLGGQDFARLMHSGWIPTGLALGISVASRHDDWRTAGQTGRLAAAQEVDGYTRLVNHARRDARSQLARDAAANGGEGVVVDEMDLRIKERECDRGSTDHIAEAVAVGTSITRFGRRGRPAGPKPLTIMRLERERRYE